MLTGSGLAAKPVEGLLDCEAKKITSGNLRSQHYDELLRWGFPANGDKVGLVPTQLDRTLEGQRFDYVHLKAAPAKPSKAQKSQDMDRKDPLKVSADVLFSECPVPHTHQVRAASLSLPSTEPRVAVGVLLWPQICRLGRTTRSRTCRTGE